MRFVYVLSVSIGLCVTPTLFAQPDSLWSRTFGGDAGDWGYSVQQTADSGFIIAGGTGSFGAGRSDVWLIKTDGDGQEVWNCTFGGDSDEQGRSVQETTDGGFVIAGYTSSFGAGQTDAWLLKTDGEGREQWNRTFGGAREDWGCCVQQTTDGGYVLAGQTRSFGEGDWDVWLIKTGEEGREQWNRTFGGDGTDDGWSVQQTAGGGFVLAGQTRSFGAGEYDVWLIKTDNQGREEWNRTFGGESDDWCESVLQTADGGFVIAGATRSFGAGEYDVWLLKTDADGNSVWSRSFGGENNDQGYSVQQTTEGGFIISGMTDSFGWGDYDVWLIKTNIDGDSLWNRSFGGENVDHSYSVQQTADGGFVIAGLTRSFGAGDRDFWLVKTGPDPVSVPESDFILHPSAFILLEPYPNPFNASSAISYQLSAFSKVNLTLYDINGRLVRTLADGWQAAGEHRLLLNAAGYPAGRYWVRLSDQWGGNAAQPVVLVK